ncbi:MFS general substrate transporter [Gloeophyllum trabeum ATCC 11539]|uniref:MFS general substrate transporter n=1 Tax=Gloeophyllum trabeum (strain ATCC 11539 / FP-39264 / Madison 617) TaxID=670483 RepID=S7Q1V4_GLOTA|nr:MFS general substrate transporter [Gloeophyllum trabeum ATCC 11539]EPQ53482.1 MFS general substrate transporter [Gloeophyllum trabeum ATCC 11539]
MADSVDIEKAEERRLEEAPSQTSTEHKFGPDIDLTTFHERVAGRLVVDPEEARIEFGDEIASRLKLSRDRKKVLWPQPTDDPEDPQNWSDGRKAMQLFIVTVAAVIPDFDSGVGIAALFALAKQYDTTTGVINNLTSNWSIFLLGACSPLYLQTIFHSYAVFALAFMVGCTFAPNLKTFAGAFRPFTEFTKSRLTRRYILLAMRCLTAFFGYVPTLSGLYVVTDLYPFHLQARKLNLWTMGFIIAPFLSPFAFGFLVARADWRWSYGVASLYGAFVVFMISFFGEETLYDRSVQPIPPRPGKSLSSRVATLVGITGGRMGKYRPTLLNGLLSHVDCIWRPHLLSVLVFEGILFGFGVGINVTNAVFLGTPPPVGYGFSQYGIAAGYATPIVAVVIGELVGRYTNDWIQNASIRKHNGVFEAEYRLWACYIAIPLYICGFVLLGASFQNHMSVGALVMGWGIAQVAIMINTVAIYAYCNDCFPKQQGEISALINLSRALGGFAVPFFQVPWAESYGALEVFGCEAAIVSGLFLLIVPALQVKGADLRVSASIIRMLWALNVVS